MKDINKTITSGKLNRPPTHLTLSNGTDLILFTISCRETWKDSRGKDRFRVNEIECEVCGKSKNWCEEVLKTGRSYLIDGFLRSELINGKKKTCIRVFKVQDLELTQRSDQIMAILENSNSLEAAINKIKLL